ncbi:hypothetical protein SRM1_02372 [Pseudomonas fluorescens]|nr:hypothetical protein SRM1_02372 [Pseudomonas fluorescens]
MFRSKALASGQGFWVYSLVYRAVEAVEMNVSSSISPPRHIVLLGYGGLLPFIGLALLILTSVEYRPFLAVALVNYGAVILSFVGALHWGFAMSVQNMSAELRRNRLIWSVIPALIAWLSTLLPVPLGCLLLIVGFVAHFWQDRQLVRAVNLHAWYLPMRFRLTAVASVCLLIGAIAVVIFS